MTQDDVKYLKTILTIIAVLLFFVAWSEMDAVVQRNTFNPSAGYYSSHYRLFPRLPKD